MYHFLMQLHDLYLFLFLSIMFTLVSLALTCIIRRVIPAHIRARDNAVMIGTSGLIGIIYGVLVGISALYLINNNSYTADAVQREANAVADVYRDSQWLAAPIKASLDAKLAIYLDSVINKEWPLMQQGKHIDNENDHLIGSMVSEVITHIPTNNTGVILQKNIILNLQNLYNARQQRIHMSYELLNPDLWIVIVVGTILILFITYIYDMNFYLHVITITATALMASSMIFLLIALDGPFQGEFAIKSDAMGAVVLLMNNSVS